MKAVEAVRGTTPPGTNDEREAAQWVERMFGRIAPRYDFLNHILSFNIDRGWRKVLLQSMAPVLRLENGKILDLCCGTGDVLLELRSVAKGTVLGVDFCHPMLIAARKKASEHGRSVLLIEADALTLPFSENSLDGISIAFGFRNLANYGEGLRELHRVIRPGGQLAILEFSHPQNAAMRVSYGLYSRVIMPAVGGLISGSSEAYRYLPESIRKFPRADQLAQMMRSRGFGETQVRLLTGGIAALHVGTKSAVAGAS
jgi:demethylmenaquinone methyltransferase / 2-methoxy-6-polyprenyl-1,4-benzoquinol methylase